MGDKNTSFFHRFATYKKKKNIVRSLEGPNGIRVEGDDAFLISPPKISKTFLSLNRLGIVAN